MKTMLMVTSQAFSLYNFRGDLIRELVKQNWQVICAAPDMDNSIANKLEGIGAQVRSISGNRAKVSVMADIKFMGAIYKLVRTTKPDAVLLYFIKPVLYGSLVSWYLSVKTRILLIEGMGYVFTESSVVVKYILRPIIRLLFTVAISCATKVIVLNEDDKKFISRMAFKKSKVSKIQGIGVDLDKFRIKEDTQQTSKSFDFAYFGRFLEHKGVLEIIEASKILKEKGFLFRIAFYGYADENPSSFTLDQILQWQSEGLIEYCGFSDDVVFDMNKCKVLLLPSYREALPRTCQEAAAMGIPSIVSNVPGCREVVVDQVTGLFVQVRNALDLAAKMEQYLTFPELALNHGTNAAKRAREIYDVRKINAEMISIFNES